MDNRHLIPTNDILMLIIPTTQYQIVQRGSATAMRTKRPFKRLSIRPYSIARVAFPNFQPCLKVPTRRPSNIRPLGSLLPLRMTGKSLPTKIKHEAPYIHYVQRDVIVSMRTSIGNKYRLSSVNLGLLLFEAISSIILHVITLDV